MGEIWWLLRRTVAAASSLVRPVFAKAVKWVAKPTYSEKRNEKQRGEGVQEVERVPFFFREIGNPPMIV